MVEVVGVRFKRAGKIYYFSTGDLALSANDKVIVETARGVEYGESVMAPRQVSEEEVVMPLKPVIRKATPEDELIVQANDIKEKEAFDVCLKKITEHQLPMKLVDVEYTFDGNKIIFLSLLKGGWIFGSLSRIWLRSSGRALNFVRSVFEMRLKCWGASVPAVESYAALAF